MFPHMFVGARTFIMKELGIFLGKAGNHLEIGA